MPGRTRTTGTSPASTEKRAAGDADTADTATTPVVATPEETTQETAAPDADQAAADQPETDEIDDAPEDALLEGAEPSWENALPLIALMAGGSFTETEVRGAVAVWALLETEGTGPTAMLLAANAELAGVPGLDGGTVTRILGLWESAGIARSEDQDGIPRWYRAPARNVYVTAVQNAGTAYSGRAQRSYSAPVSAPSQVTARVRQGTYGEWLDEYIHQNPDAEFSPGDSERFGRGYGTVHGAFKSLEARGRAVQVSTSPIRYKAATA